MISSTNPNGSGRENPAPLHGVAENANLFAEEAQTERTRESTLLK
jgi:hypothetical protein